jgi:hypothetical protein
VTTSPLLVRLTFLGLVGLLFLWVAWEAGSFPDRARIFPQTVALFGLAIIAAKVVLLLRRDDAGRDALPAGDREPGSVTGIGEEWRRGMPFLASFAAYAAGIALLGFLLSSLLFILLFLRRFDGMSWAKAGASAAAFTLLLVVIARVIGLELPEGVLGIAV